MLEIELSYENLFKMEKKQDYIYELLYQTYEKKKTKQVMKPTHKGSIT